MADIYNAKILVPELLEEGSSMGAAVIGGVGAVYFGILTQLNGLSKSNLSRYRIRRLRKLMGR